MKKVLLASTALAFWAGMAAADVSVGGDARMGVISGLDDPDTVDIDESDLAFTSRIRISFSASGETDMGLAFGGSVRVDNYEDDQATNGVEGSVFVEGTFGKISMGDVSGAPEAAVGDLSGVGLTGLGDFNEFVYLSNLTGGQRPAARWDYITGDLGVHVSIDNPQRDDGTDDLGETYGIALTYGMGNWSFGLGYEDSDSVIAASQGASHIIGGVTASFGDATVKAIYGEASDLDFTQYGLSLDYVVGATTVSTFWRTVEVGTEDGAAYGIGVSYDLGGGAALKAGYVDGDVIAPFDTDGGVNPGLGESISNGTYDFGISMSF
jgi:outer membrane protein OmpU